MTHLYIDGQEVVLPEKFSIEVRNENPIFTKGGSFTLDISLSLYPPANAKLYKHINRFNSASSFSGRKAVLIADAHVILLGMEIILEATDETVSIQLASGNSQLNYLVGNDKKMSSLDMGIVSTPPAATAVSSLSGSYPTWNYVCCPAAASYEGANIIVNNLPGFRIKDYNGSTGTLQLGDTGTNYEIRPMPYLMFLVEKTITALGFSVGTNNLRNTVYNRLFVVMATLPKRWSEVFGDMSVMEFLTEVEKLFNVNFIVRKSTNTVDILFASEHYSSVDTFSPNIVMDSFTRTYLNVEDQPASHTASNIKYAFGGNSYYNWEDTDPEVLNGITTVPMDNLTAIKNAVYTPPASPPYILKNSMFVDQETGFKYIVDSIARPTGAKDEPRRCQTFQRVILSDDHPQLELNIIPAVIKNFICAVTSTSPGFQSYTGYVQIPFVNEYYAGEESAITASERINGTSEASQSVSKISLAFYNGSKTVEPFGSEGSTPGFGWDPTPFPQAQTHYLATWLNDKSYVIDNTYATFALISNGHGLTETIYAANKTYNTDAEYKVKGYIDKQIPSPMSIWRVKGKEFACKEIRFTVGPDGLKNEFEAVLYSF